MDFAWTPAQQQMWDDTVSFARNRLCDDLIVRDADGVFPSEAWKRVAEKGILGLYLPERFGGAGCDMVTTIHTLEALGYGCSDNGFTLAVNGQMWAVQEPIFRFGSEAQIEKYMPDLIGGRKIGAHGMTERDSGSNAFSLKTTATRVDGGYLLNGEKVYIGLAPIADLILLFATVAPERGRWGITAFILDAHASGVTLGAPQGKMGLRTNPLGEVRLQDVFVSEADRLGREGAGASIFNAAMQYERSFIFTSHVGSMARQLDQTVAFASEREVGGQPVGKFQSVSNRVAEMKVRLETARFFLYKAAWRIDQGQDATLDAAMAKLVIGEAFLKNSEDAVRIHGGRGYLTEYEIERDLRDAMGGVIYSGTSDIQRNLIAGLLGL